MSAEATESNLDVVKGLIEICRDGQAGYLMAAEHARNAELRVFFTSQSMERARFAAELEKVARRLGEGDISHNSGMADRISRAWMDLKPRLGAGDAGVLECVEAGARNARTFYQQALRSGFPPEVQSILEGQAESVSDAYDQVCTLRDMGGRAA